MADISKDELRKEITAVLKDADLTTMSAKKVRQQIEEKLSIDLTSRKKEVDDIVMQCLKEQGKKGDKKNGSKKKDDDDDDEEEEEEGEEEEEEEEDDEEDDDKPAKRAANKKPAPVKRKASSEESEEEDDKESDEEYSPSKKAKSRPKGKGAGKGRKKKGSDSDSDEDWGKGKKSGGAKKAGGAKRGGGGYTKVCTLSPELAAVVGQDSMARHEVVKKVWAIIKEKNLYDPKNKQFAICNDELLKVFGVKRFRTFGMMKFLKNHFVD